ncbi:Hypothetical predicted protein, partial [Marmota monax]
VGARTQSGVQFNFLRIRLPPASLPTARSVSEHHESPLKPLSSRGSMSDPSSPPRCQVAHGRARISPQKAPRRPQKAPSFCMTILKQVLEFSCKSSAFPTKTRHMQFPPRSPGEPTWAVSGQ